MVYFGLRGRSLTIVMSVIAATAFALQGYDQAVANGLLTLPTFLQTFPETKDPTIQGTTVAIYEVGCALGALSCAFIGDILGRRRMIFVAGSTALVGITLQATPFTLAQLIVARVITGLGVGAFTATVPMYVSECVSAQKRGRRVLTQGFFAIGGIVIASWLEFGLYFVKGNSVNWRFPIAFQAVFGLIATSLILFLPESPRWLVKRDRFQEAHSVISCLEDMPEDSEVVLHELQLIRDTFVEEQHSSSSFFAMGPERGFHRAVLAIGIAILAQMSGINIVTFYSTTIFEDQLHYSGIDARIFSGCIQIWQFIAAGLAVVLIDKFGRRKLLLAGTAGMCIAQAGLAGLMSDLSHPAAGKAAIFFYFVAMFFFPVGLFLLPFMYAAEIAPLSIRAKVTAVSACANWLFNFLVAEVTPPAFANIGWRYYIVYTAINAFSFLMIYIFYPETKGRTLEEIDDIFIQSKSIFDPVRVEKSLPKGAVATAARIRQAHDLEKHGAIHAENANPVIAH
ncbi:hypothetical protein CNMCM5793_000677 [Aspergillus hiratsukae]|uniref:Major facilitator superfamily (MFS) profile domain-containing protein n=1 Tax=Aspergillus hiratsukae TaxID=1194566 RepID=A0A8H6UA09_9EURO|nr:hypothetical protein CNMCM5793_000677 [Aspergillus hiratsukae]KAF7159429.1 hypothetical protein CNMCM6106_006702 [Aspergillus hiratsukae]